MIDVIIPVYNVEKYLCTCIDSVLEQSLGANIILIDDGSTDNSGNICDEYVKNHRNISVIHKENGGLSSARNAGLDVSKGEYILFLDSDDSLPKAALETLHHAMLEYDCDAVFGGYKSIGEAGNTISTFLPPRGLLTGDSRVNVVYEHTQLVMACGKLYKRHLFENVRFRIGKLHEDVYLYHEIAYRAKSICCIDVPTYNYLQRKDSITGKVFSLRNFDAVDALFERADFFHEHQELNLEKQTVHYIFKYLLFIAHRIDFNNDELAQLFKGYYDKYKQAGGRNQDYIIKIIIFLYRRNIIKKPLLTYRLFTTVRKLCALWKSGKISFRILKGYFNIKPTAILISTPANGNLGDQAIVYAQRMLLADCGISQLIEIQAPEYLSHRNILQRIIRKKDLIVIDGGGNIGSMWPTEANRINDIINRFPNNRIIIFPETAYFQENGSGRWFYEETKRVFSSHKKLSIFLRDEPSFEIIKKMVPKGNVYICPDIVLYLKGKLPEFGTNREGVFLCMRKDSERITEDSLIPTIKRYLEGLQIKYSEGDTVINRRVSSETRQDELYSMFNEISSHKLVVTDRLHGMIFSYITNTPCIAFNNCNKKVENQLRWIKSDKQIVLCKNSSDILHQINELLNSEYTVIENEDSAFSELKGLIKSCPKE